MSSLGLHHRTPRAASACEGSVTHRRARRLLIACVCAVAFSSATTATASAADYVFWDGWMSSAVNSYPYYQALTETSARSLSGNTVCVAAQNLDGSQAGQVVCSNDLAVHAYCGCIYRYGYARPIIGGSVNARARMNW